MTTSPSYAVINNEWSCTPLLHTPSRCEQLYLYLLNKLNSLQPHRAYKTEQQPHCAYKTEQLCCLERTDASSNANGILDTLKGQIRCAQVYAAVHKDQSGPG